MWGDGWKGGYDKGGYGYDKGGYGKGGYDKGGYEMGYYDKGGYDKGGWGKPGYDGYDYGPMWSKGKDDFGPYGKGQDPWSMDPWSKGKGPAVDPWGKGAKGPWMDQWDPWAKGSEMWSKGGMDPLSKGGWKGGDGYGKGNGDRDSIEKSEPYSGPIKEKEAGPPLERHAGAERDTMPAWMKKGVGINKEMFGETTGELVKPGMTKADLEKIEARIQSDEPDPFGELFNEAEAQKAPANHKEPDPFGELFNEAEAQKAPTNHKRAPLPDQSSLFGGGCGTSAAVSDGAAKSKGKGKDKDIPKEDKPLINPHLINAAKDPLNGGVNWKGILQEQISKILTRPLQQGDLAYTVQRGMDGKIGCLTVSCLADAGQSSFEADVPAADDKQAHQLVAAKAMEELFQHVHFAALELHASAELEAAADSLVAGADGTATQNAAVASNTANSDAKSLLNNRLQLTFARPVKPGDMVYDTHYDDALKVYRCRLRIADLDGAVYESDPQDGKDKKMAEKSAARKALEANEARFNEALAAREAQKQAEKGQGKGGKGKRKYSGGDDVNCIPVSLGAGGSDNGPPPLV